MSLKLSKESLILILETRSPKSLTEAYRLLGGEGKLSGTTAKRMRELVPGIDEWVDNNKARASGERQAKDDGEPQEKKPTLPTSRKSKPAKKTSKVGQYTHVQGNPFRPQSNYALAYDILASFPDGLPLAEWRELYAKAAGKPLKLAGFDTQVLLTAKDRPTSERHRSCRSGFFIERQCDHVTLKIG